MASADSRAPGLRPGFLPRREFQRLLDRLRGAGYQCVGPRVEAGAIVYGPVASADDFPRGLRQRQAPGSYRLLSQGDQRLFAWANGPQGLKPLLFAPREPQWWARRQEDGRLGFELLLPQSEPLAVIGVRACDLAALELLDRHFLRPPAPDPWYRRRRESLFLVGVDCSHPADTCFCASIGDGPSLEAGYDLGLSELDDGFLLTPGSAAGRELSDALGLEPAGDGQLEEANAAALAAGSRQSRALPGCRLRDQLFGQLDHARWQDTAERCLACGNCTAVCPTCFCYTSRSEADPDGEGTLQVREWGSCFSSEHGSIHGMAVRPRTCGRYRQWLTHKLAGWHDQYGRSGCVGCGRCISWCPVGIDLTREAEEICGGLTDE